MEYRSGGMDVSVAIGMIPTKKLPSWLLLSEEGTTIALHKPIVINQIRMRAPTAKHVQQTSQ